MADWYLACLPMNDDLPQMRNVQGFAARYGAAAWALERPVLPAPHQVVVELYNTTFGARIIRETGGRLGAVAPQPLLPCLDRRCRRRCSASPWEPCSASSSPIGIVHSRLLSRSLMPWVIASQTIPILAIAPIIIVALGSGRDHRADPEGDHLDVSVLLPGRDRHGEGLHLAGRHAARPDAHLQTPPGRRPSGSCAGRRRRRTSSPA